MTDDRNDTRDETQNTTSVEADSFNDAAHWEAALNGALTSLLFDGSNGPQPTTSATDVHNVLHAAFDALLFGDEAPADAGSGSPQTRAWVANDTAAPSGFGRIMFSRSSDVAPADHLSGALDSRSPLISSNVAIASGRAANDNVIWIGSGDSDHDSGVYGRDPSVAVLDNGDALIAWIGADDAIHAKFIPADHDLGWDAGDSAERQKLDQLLINLGDSSTGAAGKAGRVVVTPTSQNSFAAVWTSEFAVNSVLMGTILTLGTAAHAGDREDAEAHWTVTDIAPQVLPKDTGAFTVAITDVGALTVNFAPHAHSAAGIGPADHAIVVHLDSTVAPSPELAHIVSEASATVMVPHGSSMAGVQNARHANADGPEHIVDQHETAANNGSGNHSVSEQNGGSGEHHSSAIVTIADDGTVFTPGFENGVFTIHIQTADGKDSGAVIAIEGAIDPQIAGTHNGVAVAYSTEVGSGTTAGSTVQVAAYDNAGNALGGGPVMVIASEAKAAFTDVAIAYTHQESSATPDSQPASVASAAAPSGVLVIALIENANTGGFGDLKAQLFSVPDGDAASGNGLTALGADGQAGGDDDGVFQVTNQDDGLCRAPAIEGLDDGAVAVAWVQQTEHGNGPDVIRGEIIVPGDDAAPENLDLTPFMPNGVADGSNPVLASDDAGDLIVGWIEAALTSGYEAKSAIFRHSGGHHWNPPETTITLNHFADLPRDFAIAITGSGDTLSVVIAWRDADNTVSTAQIDVSTGQSGGTIIVQSDTSHGDDAGLGVAALSDGNVLVVYGSSDGHDSSLSAAVVELPTANDPGSVISVSGSGSDDHNDSNKGSGSLDTALLSAVLQLPAAADVQSQNNGSDNSGPSNDTGISGQGSGNSGSDASGGGNSGSGNSRSGNSSGNGSDGSGGGPGSADTTVSGSNSGGGSDNSGHGSQPDLASPMSVTLSEAGQPSIVVNFASDLIQFVSNDNVSNDNSSSSASAAAELSPSHGTSGNSGDTHIPSSSDVAALEAMATPVEESSSNSSHAGNSDTSSAGSASGSNSGSASHDMVALLHDLSGGNSSGGNSSGGGSGHGGDAAPSANDNSTPHFGDTALAIASGYGNDVADYMTADEQAALVPEPISALFEALQFANAFNDASNGDVMMFDAANVVTISQFQSPDCHHSHHDLPLI
jgi:hypothetical protein